MPELVEVELYRRLAERAVGRRIVHVEAPDPWFLKRGLDGERLRDAVVGRAVGAARRIGKLLLLDTDGPTIGLRFGMTGRLLVDGVAGLTDLQYGSNREEPAWDRVVIVLEGDADVRVRDPRRLGGIELDPDEGALGVDARDLTPAKLGAALRGSRALLKARLMDQSRIAGLGNLLTDEALWRAGLDPARPAGSLSALEVRRLQRHIRATVEELLAAGGSHAGRLQPARIRGGMCPRDGTPLQRRTVGGRTTYSCPRHQRSPEGS